MPPGCYGRRGWHWRPSDEYPEHRAQDRAIAPCPQYSRVRRELLAADERMAQLDREGPQPGQGAAAFEAERSAARDERAELRRQQARLNGWPGSAAIAGEEPHQAHLMQAPRALE